LGVGTGFYIFDEPMRQYGEQQQAKIQQEQLQEPEWKIAARARQAAPQQQQQQQQER
jgi:hypothetical protein